LNIQLDVKPDGEDHVARNSWYFRWAILLSARLSIYKLNAYVASQIYVLFIIFLLANLFTY